MLDSNKLVYVAAPCFNREQQFLLAEIISLLEEFQVQYYNPFDYDKQSEAIKDGRLSEVAYEVFQENVRAIRRADLLLAVWPFVMQPGTGLHIVYDPLEAPSVSGEMEGPLTPRVLTKEPIRLPDTGVVWEMGFAYALGKPIVAYTHGVKKPNLMLAQCCMALVSTPEKLRDFVATLSPYRGETR